MSGEGDMQLDHLQQRLTFSEMLQNIIYFFNQVHIRDYVIHHFIHLLSHHEDRVAWDGTYYFDEEGMMDTYYHTETPEKTSLTEFIRHRKVFHSPIKKKFILFTCCIVYEGNKVHYLAFVYKASTKVLVAFDSGIHVYPKGQESLLPLIRKSFIGLDLITSDKHSLERVGLCPQVHYGKTWSIQYDGSDPATTKLPADSFCQSWTLFFLIEFLRHNLTDDFLPLWCKVHPKHRENFILNNMFLPFLIYDPYLHRAFKKFYPEGKLHLLTNTLTRSVWHKVQNK